MNQPKTKKIRVALLVLALVMCGSVGVFGTLLATFFGSLMKSCVDETLSYTHALSLIMLLSFIFITLIFLKANKAIKNFYHEVIYPIFMATSELKTREIIDVFCTVGTSLLLVAGYCASLSVVSLWFKLPAIVLLGSYFIACDLKISLLTRVWYTLIKRCGWKKSCD